MNELSIIFNKMGINTYEVLEAAGTKWNFLNFFPGLVGGHCIGVDPYYLSYKAKELGYHPQMIDSGRFINDSMGRYVGKQTVKKIISSSKSPKGARVLIMGITFKENVSDIRNSKVMDVVDELLDFGVLVDVVDPRADAGEVNHEYGIVLEKKPKGIYDAVIVAVNHDEYANLMMSSSQPYSTRKELLSILKEILKKKSKHTPTGACNNNMTGKILVSGGTGYIGSHTAVELQNEGFEVIIADNLHNSELSVLDGIEAITGTRPCFEKIDLCNKEALSSFIKEQGNIKAVIHFAAFKSVSESVNKPLEYYHNNILSLLNMLEVMREFSITSMVFSSSCTVYGQPDSLPVNEECTD